MRINDVDSETVIAINRCDAKYKKLLSCRVKYLKKSKMAAPSLVKCDEKYQYFFRLFIIVMAFFVFQ